MSLTDLPPELLGNIVDCCAVDLTRARAALLNLSVVNRYIRSATKPKLFERIFFRDSPRSPGDEILHSIRRFMATLGLHRYARAVSLDLRRVKCLRQDHATLSEPYHYLVLPELMQALAEMPEVTELSIRIEGAQGMLCLDGLHAAVLWGTSRQQLNIRTLTVLPYTWAGSACACEAIYNTWRSIDFFRTFPQITAFCFEGTFDYSAETILCMGDAYRQTIASNLTHLRLYKGSLDLPSGLQEAWWEDAFFQRVDFAQLTPQLEHLSILGLLGGLPVSRILESLTKIPKLKYLDITDEQMKYSGRVRHNRSRPAEEAFKACAPLRRIVFVRAGVGQVFLRGYRLPVADSTGYISGDVSDADLAEIPSVWYHGVPQTTLTPFPSCAP